MKTGVVIGLMLVVGIAGWAIKRIRFTEELLARSPLILCPSDDEMNVADLDLSERSNRYQMIAAKNVFRLQPPPPVKPVVVETPPPPKITLQGVVSAFGGKWVLFKSVFAALGEATREVSFMFKEGEKFGGVAVLEINDREGTIRFDNRGTEQLLSLERDGVKWKPMARVVADPPMPPPPVR